MSSVPHIANTRCRGYVQSKQPFKAHNLSAEWTTRGESDMYIVFSYSHWPLFIFTDGQWYENEERYSVTTSKHRSQSHPHISTTLLSRHNMTILMERGYAALARTRVLSTLTV